MERSERSVTIAIIVLAIFHEVGVIGLHLDATKEIFKMLVPMNLLLSISILAYFHKAWTVPFGIFAFVTFWAGYLIEVIGVTTGAVFGPYHYETALGFKIAGVPPLIGINWLMLVYISNIISQKVVKNIWIRATLGAILVLLLDLVIEPMAIQYDFWLWDTEQGIIPTQNYIAWGLIAWLMSFGFHSIDQEKENSIAPALYVIQLLFFTQFLVIDSTV